VDHVRISQIRLLVFHHTSFPRLGHGVKTHRCKIGSHNRSPGIPHDRKQHARWNRHHFQEVCLRQQSSLGRFRPLKRKQIHQYLDANSLYATAQCEPLPVGKFRFLSDVEATEFDFETIAPDGPTGYMIECDLEYPDRLHDIHSDYFMAPEHLEVSRDMLSPFAPNLIDPRRPWVPSKS